MFAKKFRLPSSSSTSSFQVVHTPFFVLKYSSNNLENNRYGFISSKKIDKRAVYRNKVKRQIRGMLENLHTSLAQGYDLLFLLKPSLKEVSQDQLQDVLQSTLKRALS